MLKENRTITTDDLKNEYKRIAGWVEDCYYAPRIDNVYGFWYVKNGFGTLQLIFETNGMDAEKFEELRELVDFDLQDSIPLECVFANHEQFFGSVRIY